MAVLTITGQQLKQALENGISTIEQTRGRFPQVSGIQVTYDPSKVAGERITSLKINGKAINPTRAYKLATTDYLANGGDGYHVLDACPKIALGYMDPPMLVDVFIDSIRERDTLGPVLNARLVNVHESK